MGSPKLLIATLFLCISQGAFACPLSQLVAAGREPLTGMRKVEMQVPVGQDSAEGGVWERYFRKDGSLHSVVRRDLGETGQWEVRASFISPGGLVIVSSEEHYEESLPRLPVVVASTKTEEFLYCGAAVYEVADTKHPLTDKRRLARAGELRRIFLQQKDLWPYFRQD